MNKPLVHHITIGGQPWCGWTGTQAGLDIQRAVGSAVTCGHKSGAAAHRGAKLLRPKFKHGRVKVVTGACPHAPQ